MMKTQVISPSVLSMITVVALLLLAGCSEGEKESEGLPEKPDNVGTLGSTVLEPGEGEASTLPLDPLLPGQMLLSAPISSSTMLAYRVVVGPFSFNGKEMMEVWHSNKRAAWEAHIDQGLVRYGDDEAGFYPLARLLAPTTVKLGMKWTSGGKDFEVTARQEKDSCWGPAIHWTIVERGLGNSTIDCEREYVEGFGISRDFCLSPAIYNQAIELLEPEFPIDPITPQQVEVHKTGGVAWGIGMGATNMWGLDIAPGEKPLVITMDGERTYDVAWGAPQDKEMVCVQVGPDGDTFEYHHMPIYTTLAFGNGYSVMLGSPACPCTLDDDGRCRPSRDRHAINTWMPPDGRGGVWYGQAWFDGSLSGDGSLKTDTVMALTGTPEGTLNVTTWDGFANYEWSFFSQLYGQLVGNGEIVSTYYAPQIESDTFLVGLRMASGLLVNAQLSLTSALSNPRVGPYVGPYHTVRATPTERDIVLVSPGGNVDRLVLTAAGWVRVPLANVELPWGQSGFTGGFVIWDPETGGKRLLLFSRALPLWTFSDAEGIWAETTVPLTRSWLAKIPELPPQRPWLQSLTVTAEKMGADVRVCWQGAGEPETAGWTLGGAPAMQVIPHFENKQCVAVFRDVNAALGADEPGGMIVEGPVPEAGKVRIAMLTGAGEASKVQFGGGAAVKGGGFVASNGVFEEGGIPIKPLQLDAPYSELYADAGGHGMWYWIKGGPDKGLRLVGTDSVVADFGPIGSEFVTRPYGGGLVIWNEMDGYRWFKPDATVSDMGDYYKAAYDVGILSDGRACGHGHHGLSDHKEAVYCFTADGESSEVSTEPDHSFGTGSSGDWWPVEDRWLLHINWKGLWAVDAEQQAVVPYHDTTEWSGHTRDSQGNLYANLGGVWHHLAGDGPEPLELQGFENQTEQLYVDEDFYILFLDDETVVRLSK